MSDRLTEILAVHLAVEDVALQLLRGEIMDLCQYAGGPERAIQRVRQYEELTVAHFNLNKAPWYHIYLAYARYKQPDLPLSMYWAKLAVDGFDQVDHAWNRAISRWFCALLHRKLRRHAEASFYYEEAINLMRREIVDLKRRSFYEKADQCEKVLVLLHADAASPITGDADQAPSAGVGSQSDEADNLDRLDNTGNFYKPPAELSEEVLYQNLLTKAKGNRRDAERLIEHERLHRSYMSRKESIIRAIERWEHDNR